MGYRCRWRIMGRAEPETPPATTLAERAIIATLTLKKAAGLRTIFDVFSPSGQYLGQVRTRPGGYQCYRLPSTMQVEDWEWTWVYGDMNHNTDPQHALALLALIQEAEAQSAPHAAPAPATL